MLRLIATICILFLFVFQAAAADLKKSTQGRTTGIGDQAASQIETEAVALKKQLRTFDEALKKFQESLYRPEIKRNKADLTAVTAAAIAFALPIITSLKKTAGSNGRPVFGLIVGSMASIVSVIFTNLEANQLPSPNPKAATELRKELTVQKDNLARYIESEELPSTTIESIQQIRTGIDSLIQRSTAEGDEKYNYYKTSSAAHLTELALGMTLMITGAYRNSPLTQGYGYSFLLASWLHNAYRMGLYAMNDQITLLDNACDRLRGEIREVLEIQLR